MTTQNKTEGELYKQIRESEVSQPNGRRQSRQMDIFKILNNAKDEYPILVLTGGNRVEHDLANARIKDKWFKKWFGTL